MKKLLSLALAMVMILSLSVTAFADEPDPSVPKTNLHMSGNTVATRSYKGYMLMTATNADSSKYAYTVNEKYADIMCEVLGLADNADPDLIVAAVAAKDTAGIRDFANDVYAAIIKGNVAADHTWTGADATVAQGYWMIADVTDEDILSADYQTRSLVMIDTVGDEKAIVHTKDEPVEDEKKTDDENDSLIGNDSQSQDQTTIDSDVADYDLGDLVPYNLFTKLPSNVTEYDYFVWMIKDTASAGLTFVEETFVVTVNADKSNENSYSIANGGLAEFDPENATPSTVKFLYTIDDNNTLLVFPNAGYVRHDAVVVEGQEPVLTGPGGYDVAGNVIGGDIMKIIAADAVNSATIDFYYECELNENAIIGKTGNKNTFNFVYSNDPHNDTFGETPDDVNIILTYKLDVNKIDGSGGKPLEGADFALYKFIAQSSVEREGLEELKSANAWGVWELVESKTTNAVSDNAETEEDESKEATTFTFSRIDDGFYKLVETKVPEGYNAIDPVIFKIHADHVTTLVGDTIWGNGGLTVNIEGSDAVGSATRDEEGEIVGITMDVKNNAGAELPSTGGMGTTMLYIVGGLMVMFAVVMLVTKKRMSVDA